MMKFTVMRSGSAILLAAVLSGCVSILPDPTPAPAVYRLSNVSTASIAVENAEIIRIDRPAAPTMLQSKDIIVSPDGVRLSAVAQASWAEAMPILVQDALIDSMAASGRLVPILPSSGARSQTRVQLTIKNFEAQFDQGPNSAPLAIVHYRVTYADASDRKLLGTYVTRKTVRANSVNVSSIVEAIGEANQQAMTDIVKWLDVTPSS